MTEEEIRKVEAYLRETFGNKSISVKARARKDDSVEVLIDDEFIGVIFKDDEDDDLSYDFHMTILGMDLP